MKASQFLISTLKEAPADAEVVSHQLMMRAGMIKRLSAGIYTYMPMGLRVIRKVEAIVREEMNRAGAIECTMPVVQPAELWSETGRFQSMGPELLRVKDRHERDFVIQPTSEEAVTDIARQDFRSYKQLPKNLYQIQTKFRDERRPRFGLMRGREFIMKDAYSFDRDEAGAKKSYQVMAQAYRAIFDRFGLTYRAVAADSGAIGGDLSEEFQVIAATGEDAIVYATCSDYAANMEKAEALAPAGPRPAAVQPMTRTPTPGKATCAEKAVCEYCGKAYGKPDSNNHTDLKHIDAKAATKTAEGNIEYWYCGGCDKYYSDKDGINEIKKADTVTAKLPGNPKSPRTGNASDLALWISLLLVSGGVTGVTAGLRKKKKHKV